MIKILRRFFQTKHSHRLTLTTQEQHDKQILAFRRPKRKGVR